MHQTIIDHELVSARDGERVRIECVANAFFLDIRRADGATGLLPICTIAPFGKFWRVERVQIERAQVQP